MPRRVLMELVPRRIYELRFSPYTARPHLSLGYLECAINHIARGDGEQVGRDRDWLSMVGHSNGQGFSLSHATMREDRRT